MLDLVVGLDSGGKVRIVLVGLQQAVCYRQCDEARQREDEEREELGLQ